MKFRTRSAQAPRAAGFPSTDLVRARRLRARGDILSRSGHIVLQNGSNAFSINPAGFAQISVRASAEGGEHHIVGFSSLDDGAPKTLAKFGSAEAAANGHAALMKAVAGINVGGASALGKAAKWGGVAVGVLVLTTIMGFMSLSSGGGEAVAATQQQAPAMFAAAGGVQAGGQGGAGKFNPQEPSLEELASGNYQFSPKLKAPEVEVPTLNCAKPGESN